MEQPPPPIPLLSESLDELKLQSLRLRIETDKVTHIVKYRFRVVFRLASIEPAEYVRAIQELEMLKTKVAKYDRVTRKVATLPSFIEVWNSNGMFRNIITKSHDPHEEKWQQEHNFNYKLATNFMPMYARSIYEYFDGGRVLDGCAGWGE